MEDRFLKRLRKKARKGLRGWPIATIAFYGPNEPSDEGHRLALCPPRMQRWKSCATGKWIVVTSEPTQVSPGRYWNLSRSIECYPSR